MTETSDNSGTTDDEDETPVLTPVCSDSEEEQLTLDPIHQEAELISEVPSESECCNDGSLEQPAVLHCQSACCSDESRPYH